MHYLAAIRFDSAGDKVEVFAEGAVGGVLVRPSQPTVPSHIRIQDGAKLTGQTFFHKDVTNVELGLPEILYPPLNGGE